MIKDISELRERRNMVLSTKNREPVIEDRFNIHIGEPYRIIISGINALDSLTFDGILTRINADFDDKGFTLREVELLNGIQKEDLSGKRRLFDKEIIETRYNKVVGFGSIIDEDCFNRVYHRLKEEGI